MHAIVLHEYGPAANLRYETVPDPEPGPGQVRIAVRAAGVHFIETVMRTGVQTGLAPPPPELPSIFGGEVAGTVESVGPEVDAAWLGARVVVSASEPGGYAELAVAEVSALHRVPAEVGFEAAVAMVVTGTTALQFLDVAELTAEDTVLITSAAGGIGQLLVQYARGLGATVIGAAGGPEKVEVVRALGADLVLDYNEPGWEKAVDGRPVTVVLDGVGGAKAEAAYRLLADGGRLLTIGTSSQQDHVPDPELAAARGITTRNALLDLLGRLDEGPAYEVRALAAVAEGKLVPAVHAFPLAEAAAAHAALENRATSGKVVLVP
ncbi:zinc-binding dehydrogenase [Amycolatopsis sp. 195334CR]|uniref:zinc-binding dehydrogenase n=1 Tax=Amycolatopsis sp. 195334CR TaxID=2814588 RepID=UPI001A8D4AA4|nr:zinc-binding dehydrogenase [Amycolatopsis sp. 195334CR]MBN6037645.1 zinc-binding dehydrogenase [Amycolatopsis sp. 195334CR]